MPRGSFCLIVRRVFSKQRLGRTAMKVSDVMSRGVLSVGPQDPVRKAAELMLRYGVNGFPVLDQGKLIGMITQGDFLRRAETGTGRHRSRLAEVFAGSGELAGEYVRTHAGTVADIMTRDVITVSADAPLSDAVELMAQHHVKRLPVVANGGVIGIISRVDLLHAFLVATPKEKPAPLDDAAILSQLKAELDREPWIKSGTIKLSVENGVVVLSGTVQDARQRTALRVAAENIPGVKRVVDDMP
jgi:CBS domain-containing protein